MSSRNIELFIIRHGERLDEAIWRDFDSKHSNARTQAQTRRAATDSFDPLLTARGHRQAHDAFDRLTATLLSEDNGRSNDTPRRRIAVFSSPLRRVVGTALMIGTVSIGGNNHGDDNNNNNNNNNNNDNDNNSDGTLEFPPVPGDDSDASGAIPVTILNDLANSAAAVFHNGGVEELVPNGFLRCASMESNDGSDASPFVRAIRAMPVTPQMDHRNRNHNHNRTNNNDTLHCCRPVRFWKRRRCENGPTHYSPLSEPIRPGMLGVAAGADGFSYPSTRGRYRRNRPAVPTRNPLLGIDEAVRIASDRGCNVCIVVAHRETIRDLAAERCGRFGSLKMPYGCIGSFAASVSVSVPVSSKERVRYRFHDVWPIERFCAHAIPRSFPGPAETAR
eukprot:jgi/Psemu1/1980/gm1.1980_g